MHRLKLTLVLATVLALAGGTSDAAPPPRSIALANPGFENGLAGWQNAGDSSASFTEAGGHSGSYRLTHRSAAPYAVTTSQTVTGVPPGWITLSAWARRSTDADNSSSIALTCGGPPVTTAIPAESSGWLHLVASTHVKSDSCTISLRSVAGAGEWSQFDDVGLTRGPAKLSILGADVSSLNKSEHLGGVYRDASGRPGDALRILRDHGLNWIRLRVWVNPADGYHDQSELLTMARRAQALGLSLLVDLHYSDFWADPGKQWTPAAWDGLSYTDLRQAFVAYTRDAVQSLVDQGTPPALVQLGNEIDPGILWDYAGTWEGNSCADDGFGNQKCVYHHENWDHLADLLSAGYAAVKDVSPSTQVMLHVSNGGDNGLFRWWFDNLKAHAGGRLPCDVIGMSYYEYWHGTFAQLQGNIDDVASRYAKDVVVAETAYPFTLADADGTGNIIGLPGQLAAGYPATPAGQAANLRDVMSIVRAVPDGRGLGVFYWEATWTAVPGNGWAPNNPASGNGWENQALWDYEGLPLPAIADFSP
jgi:arabinogalactan endo-1,4-beta-galactosidase